MIDEPALARQISWWGFYGGDFDDVPEPAPPSESFRLRIYGARPTNGLPDENNVIFEQTLVDPERVATGRVIATGAAPPEYVFAADLTSGVHLEAGVPLWLEIVQLGLLESHYRWEISVDGNRDFAFLNDNLSDWTITTINADLAFQLSSVPEPSTAALTVVGFLGAGMLRSRKEAYGS